MDEPDSNRWPTACAAALPLSFRPLEEHRLPRFGIRRGSAARTGRDASPYRCSVFGRCSALPAVANRQSVRARRALVGVLSTCSPRRGITTQRTCASRSRAPASGRARALPGCPRAERNFRGGKKRTSMHAHPPRTPKTERPRVWRPEGVRVPRRSGWPISQGVSRMSEVQVPCAFGTAQVAAFRTQHQAAARGLQGGLAVEGIGGLHGKKSVAEERPRGRRARTIRRLFAMRNTFFILFSKPDRR